MKNPLIVALQKIVDTAVGVEKYSYPMYQNAPRPPNEKFAAIRMLASRNPGYDNISYYEKDGKYIQRIEGIREIMFDVLFNRDNSDILKFDSAFFRQDVQDKCEEMGLELLRKKPTNLRTRSLETNWEIRTGITCIFSNIVVYEHEANDINEFNIEGKYNEGDFEKTIFATATRDT